MRDAVIVDAVRTPIGKRNGALAGIHPVNLSAHVLRALAERNSLDAALVDDVIWGCATQVGEQTGGIGRFAVLAAGWPEQIPAVTVERQCGSSQQAVHQAAAGIMAGHYDVAIAGGVESMSRVPMGSGRANGLFGHPFGPAVAQRYPNVQFNQGLGAEMIAAQFGLSRRELDEHALDSHRRAATATDEGRFTAQIAPVPLGSEDGSQLVSTDEGIRRETTLAQLGALKTPFLADGVISAGNASQISDGAAALLLTTPEVAAREGWTPMARVREVAVVGVDPVTMLLGPIPATQKVLARAGLSIEDIGVYEINEAFASVSLAWQRAMDADYKRLNPNGGAIALGHPLGGSGARLMTTLVHHMRDTGARYGLQSMCEFGGMANATILELV
jgi:acetyl-CoA acyltransferase